MNGMAGGTALFAARDGWAGERPRLAVHGAGAGTGEAPTDRLLVAVVDRTHVPASASSRAHPL